MSIIKKATLLPLQTFITIILNYSVVMFWSSSWLLLSVSTPGSTSFVQSSYCPLTGSLYCCSTSCLSLSIASTFFVDAFILTVASTGISKPPFMSGDCRKRASFTVTKTSAPLEIRNLVKRLISRGKWPNVTFDVGCFFHGCWKERLQP